MVNEKELRKKMIDSDYTTISKLAEGLGCTKAAAGTKIKGKIPFKVAEIEKAAELLNLTMHDVNVIFFDDKLTEQ